MTYRKPEISALGDAARVIQITGRKDGTFFDPVDSLNDSNPAYDLDE